MYIALRHSFARQSHPTTQDFSCFLKFRLTVDSRELEPSEEKLKKVRVIGGWIYRELRKRTGNKEEEVLTVFPFIRCTF